ncbi:hypothetical protein CP973_34855 [Streptomyces albofaciens JCM 4342]|uniref:hypothetical protein n=1 Tax=Streptomyces albofaciens TaxID=66866 RepID=UPI0012395585|nr:hypothetical protein [Streptomyces albofaciens]KAA6214293.1 hypothetical protein CP973_34855 [Streptomyces albofaciens JCM 4342]
MTAAKSEVMAGELAELTGESDEAAKRLRRLAAGAYQPYGKGAALKVPKGGPIRAGRAGGLPFDSLTTDLMLGCLPASQVCYGSCFAAKGAFESGYDFGTRVPNVLDEEVFRADLAAIPATQGYLRNGWNSDASWDWPKAVRLTELIRESGHHTVFITKVFTALPDEAAVRLAELGAELRVSVSAFDSRPQLRMRLTAIEQYRDVGGVAVPTIMTAAFRDAALARRQDRIVAYFCDRDFPMGENSLRFVPGSPVLDAIDHRACRPTADTKDLWSGRLYPDLRVPTLTCVPARYTGLQSPYLSKNDPDFLRSLWHESVPLHTDVLSDAERPKPRQCGVALDWDRTIGSEPTGGEHHVAAGDAAMPAGGAP